MRGIKIYAEPREKGRAVLWEALFDGLEVSKDPALCEFLALFGLSYSEFTSDQCCDENPDKHFNWEAEKKKHGYCQWLFHDSTKK